MIQLVARRALTAWLTGALLIACVAACGNPTGTAAEPKSSNQVDSGPGPVALEYMRAVARGDFKAAIPLVAPSQRAVLEAIALGQGPKTLPEVTGDVSVGEVVEEGDRATVSIVGKMCRARAAAGSSTSTPASDCVENDDPRTKSPVFLLHLAREDATGWKVIFNFAATSGPGDSGEH
ncbi:nuclear transport factor 2 family protein [Micromonospora tarensis]|uniref:DUF4878 domain-containing protein n=1 Tax=Micromonospora tarensis TaxID=2806100 RepID=A0ABS1YJR2_9ACTN|nr:hypothetical protein [Micromonospora tarensis]MBM0277626.1 hypothetical protein [Micromonospora tarensis]